MDSIKNSSKAEYAVAAPTMTLERSAPVSDPHRMRQQIVERAIASGDSRLALSMLGMSY